MKGFNDSSRNGSAREDAIAGDRSRRRFLARAGASVLGAGASALALPLLNRAAHGQETTCPAPTQPCTSNCPTPITPPGSPTDTPPSCTNVPNVDDGEWLIRGCCTDTVCGYNAASINVSGVRHYCAEDPGNGSAIPWGTAETNPNGSPFPARPDNAFFCMSIYPVVSVLLGGGYDTALLNLFQSCLGRDMLSCWHELAGGKTDATGYCIQPSDAVNMQQHILNLRNNNGFTSPQFGAIECGNGNQGPDPESNPDYGTSHCQPWMSPGLDFYGNDLYYSNYAIAPDTVLAKWDEVFGSGSTYTLNGSPSLATIAVCECNVSQNTTNWRDLRPAYFNRAAYWLWNQKNRNARCFLTYWRYDGVIGESGPWNTSNTGGIAALQAIGSGSYSNPSMPS
jgi:hypothetical protein